MACQRFGRVFREKLNKKRYSSQVRRPDSREHSATGQIGFSRNQGIANFSLAMRFKSRRQTSSSRTTQCLSTCSCGLSNGRFQSD